MMRVVLAWLAFFGVWCGGVMPAALAADKLLAVDLAEDHVDITTGFNGVHLTLFGVQDEPGDIAITISGPVRKTIVRQKKNVMGVWMNGRSMTFRNVPVYYGFSVSKPAKEMAGQDVLDKHRIGLDSLKFSPRDEKTAPAALKLFQEALVRNKQEQKLFSAQAGEVRFIAENFFRTSFYIPSNAPVGEYTIRTFLIRDGAVQDTNSTKVRVAQVGMSATVFGFAHDWSLAYGLFCVLFAMGAGWLSSAVRQRLR